MNIYRNEVLERAIKVIKTVAFTAFILFGICIAIVGIMRETEKKEQEKKANIEAGKLIQSVADSRVEVEILNSDKVGDDYEMHKLEFEGHTYLVLKGEHTAGICHDQNCKCKKTSEVKNEEPK